MTSFRASRGAAAGLYGCQRRREPVGRGLSTGGRRPALICEGGGGALQASLLQVALEEGDESRRADVYMLAGMERNHDLLVPVQLVLQQKRFSSSRPQVDEARERTSRRCSSACRHPPPPSASRLLLHLMHFKSVCISSVC